MKLKYINSINSNNIDDKIQYRINNKGFLITYNKSKYLLLQSNFNQSILTCKDYLQLFNLNTLLDLQLDNTKVSSIS